MSIKFSVIVPMYYLGGDLQALAGGLDALAEQTAGAGCIEVILAGTQRDVESAGKILAGSSFAGKSSFAEDNIAAALRAAIEAASGELMVVYDPRNRWEKTAFSVIYDYFHSAPELFDILACRPYPNKSIPVREYKFMYTRGTRVSTINAETTSLFTDLNCTVIRSSAAKACNIDERIDYNIDGYLSALILAAYPKFGVLEQELIKREVINHDGYKHIYDDERQSIEAVMRYHDALLDLMTDYNSKYICRLIMYDLRSFVVDRDYICHYSQDSKELFRQHLAHLLERLPDYAIDDVPQLTTIQRWGLYLLKQLGGDDTSAHHYDPFKKKEPFHYRFKSMFSIQQIDIEGKTLIIDGMSPAFLTGEDVQFFARTQDGKRYDPENRPHKRIDILNCFGEVIGEGRRLTFRIPVRKRSDIKFYLRLNGVDKLASLEFGPDTDLKSGWKNTCFYTDEYIVSCRGHNSICIREKTLPRVLMNERNISRERRAKKDIKGLKKRKEAFKIEKAFYSGSVKNQVAFATARSNTTLMDNMQHVWDCCDEQKVVFTRRMPYSNEDLMDAVRTAYRSKVIVTDDYFYPLRRYGKRKDQYAVQIWHAPGAFKKFGVNVSQIFPGTDEKYHRDYDLVVVSSEYVRQIYADSFGIDVSKVQALGMPRTDIWFDEAYLEEHRKHVYEKYPQLEGKQVILYAPSFREPPGRKRVYIPEVDFTKINDALNEDQIMVLCPHPVMPEFNDSWDYDKILMVRDVPTSDMMLAADILVTDYSSVIFEYSLLNKPMAFFCYDYDEYDRDFYLDYDTELPGEVFRDTNAFAEYLSAGKFECSSRLAEFREKYMSACDGSSSRRVAAAISEFMKK